MTIMMNVTGSVYTLSPDGQLQSYIFLRAIAPELESLTERLNELIRSGEKEYKSREVLLKLIMYRHSQYPRGATTEAIQILQYDHDRRILLRCCCYNITVHLRDHIDGR